MNRVLGFGPTITSSARIWDALRGGKDNYPVDREIAEKMLCVAPDTGLLVSYVQQFHHQATRSAARARIKQFIDLGTGMPTGPADSVGAIAREVIASSARVVYIDNDPLVQAHADALLANAPGLTVLNADIRQPDEIVGLLKQGLIDFTKPVALSAICVLDHVLDHEGPAAILAAFGEVMAPGSRLVLTHSCDESTVDLMHTYNAATVDTPAEIVFRSAAEIASLADGFDLTEPGLKPVQQLISDRLPRTRMVILGAEYTLTDPAPATNSAHHQERAHT
ncbi:SAM-dependent methyltransferase [Nocardia brasiliensis]|uniref:SAM-dependent methyltransferase n=1 Tax=Nocardia brasiliensis TaxID=37326 RepID=UPI0033DBAEB7